jgi:hypothetical protein
LGPGRTHAQQPEQRQGDTSTDPFQKFLRQFGFEDIPDGMQDWQFGQNWPFRILQMQTTAASDIHGWIGVRIQAVTADITDPGDLARKIGAMAPGTEVKLSIQRKGEEKTVSLMLGQQPEQRQANTGTDRRVMPGGTLRRSSDRVREAAACRSGLSGLRRKHPLVLGKGRRSATGGQARFLIGRHAS